MRSVLELYRSLTSLQHDLGVGQANAEISAKET